MRGREPLPNGRGSDWGFRFVHFCVAHPRYLAAPLAGATGRHSIFRTPATVE